MFIQYDGLVWHLLQKSYITNLNCLYHLFELVIGFIRIRVITY